MSIDLISFVANIPGTVEGFVKTARAIVAYNNIETKYANTIEDAIYYAEKLAYLSHFVDGAQFGDRHHREPISQQPRWLKAFPNAINPAKNVIGPSCITEDILSLESQRILYGLFQKATSALKVAHNVVLEWAIRLDLIDVPAAQLLIAKFALSMSDKLVRLAQMQGRKSAFTKMRSKLSLLALGCIAIEDAMGRLKHWLAELHDMLLASPKLELRILPSRHNSLNGQREERDDLLFVAIARDRDRRPHPAQRINDRLFTSARPLDCGNSELFFITEGPFQGCLIDRRNVLHFTEVGRADEVLSDTERMVRLFAEEHDELGHSITASVGVLPCCGFSISEPGYHDLVFRLPANYSNPRTLRRLLLEEPRHTLNDRLGFSIKLCSAVLIIHSLGLLHKDIRPDSVILVEPFIMRDAKIALQRLGEPYLTAFHQSRFQSTRTVPMSLVDRQARAQVWSALYRHPRHLNNNAQLPHEPRDDIFSLGVCLLEVAIWKSLFSWNADDEVFECDKHILDFTDERYVEAARESETPSQMLVALRCRDIIEFAEMTIPITMGTTFKDVVVECLTFGEEKPKVSEMPLRRKENQKFLQDQSVNFVQHVLMKLRSLKLN